MAVRCACPGCGPTPFKKNGPIPSGEQNHQGNAGGRQAVASAEDRSTADERPALSEPLWRARSSLRGSCRAVGVSLTRPVRCMAERLAAWPEPLHVQPPAGPTGVVLRQLEADADEMWGLAGKRANQPWIRSARDARARHVIALHAGDHGRDRAKQLRAKLPWVYRAQATCHADQDDAHAAVIPPARHKALTKHARNAKHIERFKNPLRQRGSRLVRETASFSKTPAHHRGAIGYFIGHDNLTRAAALPMQHYHFYLYFYLYNPLDYVTHNWK